MSQHIKGKSTVKRYQNEHGATNGESTFVWYEVIVDGTNVYECNGIFDPTPEEEAGDRATADLIAEAFNVQEATGFTPQELSDRFIKLKLAVGKAGWSIMQTSGEWSIHCTTDAAKAAEEFEGRLVVENIGLEARVAELEAALVSIRERCDGESNLYALLQATRHAVDTADKVLNREPAKP